MAPVWKDQDIAIEPIVGGAPGSGTAIVRSASGDLQILSYKLPRVRLYTLGTASITEQSLPLLAVPRAKGTAVDSSGAFHLTGVSMESAYYSTNATGDWVTRVISPDFTLYESALALSRDGKAHICYFNYYPKPRLRYATNQDGAWVVETAAEWQNYTYKFHCGIALDSNGKAFICYYRDTSKDLLWATNRSGSWLTETVDATGDSGKYCTIALDSGGKSRIAYSGDDKVKVAVRDDNGWSHTTVDESGGSDLSYVLDANSKEHIAYWGDSNLKYSTNATGAWRTMTVDGADQVGRFAALFVDSGGRPHFSYQDYKNKYLLYATSANEGWRVQTVDESGSTDSGNYHALVLDGSGHAHTAFLDGETNRMTYATNTSGRWAAERLGAADTSENPSLAVDGNGKIHIVHAHADGLVYSTNASGSWAEESLTALGSGSAFHPSLALDRSGKAHLGYRDPQTNQARYAHNSGGTWSMKTVGTGVHDSSNISLALDGNDKVHLLYYDADSSVGEYAFNLTGTWQYDRTVPQAGDLVIDANGKAHISSQYREKLFPDRPDNEEYRLGLMYTTNASGGWTSEKIDTGGYSHLAGYGNSIAVDANGKAHISYQKAGDVYWFLTYATNVSGQWKLRDVSTVEWGTKGATSIALDQNGLVHLSYRAFYGLYHARLPAQIQ